MRLFAEQISDALGNVIAVGIHDLNGKLLWAADFDARIAGYERLVFEARRARLVELAKEAELHA